MSAVEKAGTKGMTRAEALKLLTASGEPYELVQRQLFDQTVRAFANAPVNLGQLFSDARSDATFLVYENERLTFEENLAACEFARDCAAG